MWKSVHIFVSKSMLLISVFLIVCLHVPTGFARDPKPSIGTKGGVVFVDVAKLNLLDAKRAIQGQNLRVRGIPTGTSTNGSLRLDAKDGSISVSGINLPHEVSKHLDDGSQVTMEIEGGIKTSKTKNGPVFQAVDIRRMTWEVRDESGQLIDRGEQKAKK